MNHGTLAHMLQEKEMTQTVDIVQSLSLQVQHSSLTGGCIENYWRQLSVMLSIMSVSCSTASFYLISWCSKYNTALQNMRIFCNGCICDMSNLPWATSSLIAFTKQWKCLQVHMTILILLLFTLFIGDKETDLKLPCSPDFRQTSCVEKGHAKLGLMHRFWRWKDPEEEEVTEVTGSSCRLPRQTAKYGTHADNSTNGQGACLYLELRL